MEDNNIKRGFLDRISPFSLILIMTILTIIGAVLIPRVDVRYRPSAKQGDKLNIGFSWSGASPRVLEQEVTSRIEGAVSAVKGVESVRSISNQGDGSVYITLKDVANISSVRYEISSLIKQIATKLPDGVSYPSLSGGSASTGRDATKRLLDYRINANMRNDQIKEYADNNIKPIIEQIEGVAEVSVSGEMPQILEITYNPLELANYGITVNQISEGITNFIGHNRIVGDIEETNDEGVTQRITVRLESSSMGSDLNKIPVATVNGKTIFLGSIADMTFKDRPKDSYFRINGLNTSYISISVDEDTSLIAMSKKVRGEMDKIIGNLVDGYHVELINDSAKEISKEINKLVRRTVLSLLILMLFVWLINRNLRYLSIIAVTLVANVFISVILYYIFAIELHIISLAGIAVSFGIIIDTSIVMVDHYCYYRNRKVFIAILAALLTTIGSLAVIFFMPDYVREDLGDFSSIIIINLSVSLFVSLFFVPAIIEKYNFRGIETRRSVKVHRRVVALSRWYVRYIAFTQKRKWIYITIFLLAFSGSFILFASNGNSNYHRQQEREIQLNIQGTMPIGGTAEEMNEIVLPLEAIFSTYDEIDRYETQINSGTVKITVKFKEKHRNSDFPFKLENKVISTLLSNGDAEWSIFGVSRQGFSNGRNITLKQHRISISGYNYDKLFSIADELARKMQENKNVTDIEIQAGGNRWGGEDATEMYIRYDPSMLALYNVDASKGYSALNSILNTTSGGTYKTGDTKTDISLVSSLRDEFDLWHLMNSYVSADGEQVRYSHLAEIGTRKARASINKINQEYGIAVAFNYLGSSEQSSEYIENTTEELNRTLPVGFKTENSSDGYRRDTGEQYWLMLVIIAIIFFVCAILFESLIQPLVIITLIPISFIGTFLTFYFSEVEFGSGGFASLVLLSGLVVNAAIYIINEYNNTTKSIGRVRVYVKAYNHKIIPIFLTIISTVLGLVPFLMDGVKEQFWFSFAIGTVGGLLFSAIAIVFFMPIIMSLKRR